VPKRERSVHDAKELTTVFDEEYHIFGRKSSSSVTNGRNVRGEGCVKIPSAIPRDGWYGDVYTAHYSHHGCIGTEDFSASSDCINGCRGVYKVQKEGGGSILGL
jgi:hypothetical protein